MSTIPTFVNEQSGMTTCTDHAGRYLTAALNKRPDLKSTNTPLGRWFRVDGDQYKCETCNNSTTPEEDTMPIAIATPVKKSKPAAKAAPKKETTTVPAKTKTPVAKPAAKAEPKAKPVAKKAPATKKAPTTAATAEPKMFIVYKDITNDVTAQARKAKSFSPIRYESVISGKTIVQARKALAELKGDEAESYDVIPSYDKNLTNKALARFEKSIEKVEQTAIKNTFKVTLRNVDGLTQDEIRELALLGWAVDAAKKSAKPVGNEGMLDRDFEFGELKALKNGRANLIFTAK